MGWGDERGSRGAILVVSQRLHRWLYYGSVLLSSVTQTWISSCPVMFHSKPLNEMLRGWMGEEACWDG